MALLFNGTTNYLRVPYVATLAGTTNLTLSAWVKPSAQTGEIMGRHIAMSTANSMYALDIASGAVRMGIGQPGLLGLAYGTQRASGGTVTTGQWCHVAGTWDGTTILVYLNGVQVGTSALTGSIMTGTTPLCLGAHFDGTNGSNFFGGEIEDVRQYNRTLTPGEIQTIYAVKGRDGMVLNMNLNIPLCVGTTGQVHAASAALQDVGPNQLSVVNITSGTRTTETVLSNRSNL